MILGFEYLPLEARNKRKQNWQCIGGTMIWIQSMQKEIEKRGQILF